MPLDLVLRRALLADRGGALFDIGIANGRIVEIAADIARRRAAGTARWPAGDPRLRRDPHSPRQILHPRPLPVRARNAGGSDRLGGGGQARLHRIRHLRPRAKHPGEGHRPGHDAHAHARGGRSPRRAPWLQRRPRAQARLRLGDRSADLRLSAGGPDQRSRHRGTAGGSLRARRGCHRRMPLHRHRSADAHRAHLRHRPPLRPRHRLPSRFRHRSLLDASRRGVPADRRAPLGRARRDRPRHQALGRGSFPPGRDRPPSGGCRRCGHGAAGNRPVPDGARARASRAARRRARASPARITA